MDCRTAKEWMPTALVEGSGPVQDVRAHLSQCPGCRAEFEELKRTWVLLGAWTDAEPPTRLDRTILAEIGAETERGRSWFGRLASVRVWATAAMAVAVAIAASVLVPYENSLRLCGKLLAEAGLSLPALPLSFLVGLPYALLSLLIAGLAWMSLKGNGRVFHGITVGQVFTVIMVPYVLFACVDLETTVVAGILMGTVTGALLGGAVTQWLIRDRPAAATA